MTDILARIKFLQKIQQLLFGQYEPELQPDISPNRYFFFMPSQPHAPQGVNVRACAHAMHVWTTLVLALHRALARRAAELNAPQQDQLLAQEVRALAWVAVAELARTLSYIPSLGHLTHLHYTSLHLWAEFCLDEADALGGVPPGCTDIFETCVHEMFGFSYLMC